MSNILAETIAYAKEKSKGIFCCVLVRTETKIVLCKNIVNIQIFYHPLKYSELRCSRKLSFRKITTGDHQVPFLLGTIPIQADTVFLFFPPRIITIKRLFFLFINNY